MANRGEDDVYRRYCCMTLGKFCVDMGEARGAGTARSQLCDATFAAHPRHVLVKDPFIILPFAPRAACNPTRAETRLEHADNLVPTTLAPGRRKTGALWIGTVR